MDGEPVANVLELEGVSKRFPGVVALDDVAVHLRSHEVLGLIGENGAGKSSLMKVLAGIYAPDSGVVRLRGEAIRPQSVRQATEHGIAMVFQEQSLITNITVAENLFLGNEDRFVTGGVINWRAMHAAARTLLERVQLEINPGAHTADLSFAQRQLVELAKALSVEERTRYEPIILLDEPTSVLSQAEIDLLFTRVRELKSHASFIFVSHRLDEVLELSDRIYVMKDGRVVAERIPGQTSTEELYRLMVGRDRNQEYYRESEQRPYDSEQVVFSVQGLKKDGAFRDISFDVHAGEVVSICGVAGSGREAVCRALAGAIRPDAGILKAGGREVRFRSPRDAVAHDVAYVPVERKVEGLASYLTIAQNITLPNLAPVKRAGFIDFARERRLGANWIARLGIRAPGPDTLVASLSGGNQQKVVLSKWLSNNPRLLVLDHPTRGLDVGAKEDVYRLVREISANGVGVVLTSDTLEESIGLGHTVLVMKDGEIAARFDANDGNKPRQLDIVHHML